MEENRSEPRITMDLPIVAWWADETGVQRFSYGKLQDISNSGLRFVSRESISVGTKVFLRTPMGEYVGSVLRSLPDGDEFQLGLKKFSVLMAAEKTRGA